MIPVIGFSVVVQIFCAVHCVRNGRNRMWLTVIIFLSLPGCLAYAIFEILPEYTGRREVRTAKAAVVRKIDPEREVRAAREALDLADTVANRIALGDALVEVGRHGEAVPWYREALARMPSGDRATQLKLARAQLESGNSAEAKKLLETLPQSGSGSENDRAKLLLARALEECGETAEALAFYADAGARLPGGEAQCRQAALLVAQGRAREALPVLVEVERLQKRLDKFERAQNSEMYDWAQRTLAELRSGSA